MAVTRAGARLTEAHRLAQARLGGQTVVRLLGTWRLLDPFNLDATAASWLEAAQLIVEAQREASAGLADTYLRVFRRVEAAGAAAGFVPVRGAALDRLALRTSLLVTGPVGIKAGTRRGLSVEQIAAEAARASARAGMRHAMNGGRDTVIATLQADDRAVGWARATSGRPCAFCAMLASRGPVYSREAVDFHAHDGCSCGVEPAYSRNGDWPEGTRRWADLWAEAKDSAPGDVPDAVQFRRLIESRA